MAQLQESIDLFIYIYILVYMYIIIYIYIYIHIYIYILDLHMAPYGACEVVLSKVEAVQ